MLPTLRQASDRYAAYGPPIASERIVSHSEQVPPDYSCEVDL